MTILPRLYEVSKGELIVSVIFQLLLLIVLLPLVSMEYVSDYKFETLISLLLISIVSGIYFYFSIINNSELTYFENFLINLIGKSHICSTHSLDKSNRCNKCNTGNRLHLDYICQKGYITLFGFETSYHFSQHLCNNCGQTSNIKLEKLSYGLNEKHYIDRLMLFYLPIFVRIISICYY